MQKINRGGEIMNQKADLKSLNGRVIKIIDELADITQGYAELEAWNKMGILETVINDLKDGFLDDIMNS